MKAKLPKRSKEDILTGRPKIKFKEKTPQQKAFLQKRKEALLKQRKARAEEYMTKDYRDFPPRKELK